MAISILVTPILTRLYSPEDYGVWGVISSVSMIVSSVIFFSYENAIIQTKDEKEVPTLIAICIISSMALILLVSTIFYIGKIIQIPFFERFPPFFYLFIILFVTAINTLLLTLANRYSLYRDMSTANIVAGASQALSRFFFIRTLNLKEGLIWGNILSLYLSSHLLFTRLFKIFRNEKRALLSIINIKKIAKKYKQYPLYDAPARFIEYTVGNIVIIILSSFFNSSQIGCYTILAQLILLPITLIGTSMSRVFFQETAEVIDNNDKLSRLFSRSLRICGILSVLPLLFLTLGGDKILVIILGSKWQDAGSMALCLSAFSIPVILSEPLLPVFKVLNKQNLRFLLNVIGLIVTIGSLLIAAFISDDYLVVLLIYSISYAAVRFVMFYYEIRLMRVGFSVFRKYLYLIAVSYSLLIIRLVFIL